MPDSAASQSTGVTVVRVDTWDAVPDGPLDLSRDWQLNPRAPSNPFRNPPAIVVDGAQRALHLKTDRETMSIWRLVQADLRRTPRLTWEWKAVALPEGADVRGTETDLLCLGHAGARAVGLRRIGTVAA